MKAECGYFASAQLLVDAIRSSRRGRLVSHRRLPLTRALARTTAVLLTMMSTMGCQSTSSGFLRGDDNALVSQHPTISAEARSGRGRVLMNEPFDDVDTQLSQVAGASRRMVYQSIQGISGRATEVSGAAFMPKGLPPGGGWPIIAIGHGTTGIAQDCGVSSAADLKGLGDQVAAFLSEGYAVAITDYEGLGAGGPHLYLEPHSAAYNVFDSVRALRALFPAASAKWIAFGGSQGGQAAWAVDEFDADYGDGLDLVGSVAIAPAVNLVSAAEESFTGTLTGDQLGAMPLVVVGLVRAYPELRLDDYLQGRTRSNLEVIIGCGPNANSARGATTAADVKPRNVSAAQALRDALRRNALPQQPLSVPMLVINGQRDTAIPQNWINGAVRRACEMGGVVDHVEISTMSHLSAPPADLVRRWIGARFAGEPPESTCS
jgi:alpha-beta hydrolase superfamily lysophospholipase